MLEEFVRLLHHCGMSLTEVDICNGRGATVNVIMAQGEGGGGLGLLESLVLRGLASAGALAPGPWRWTPYCRGVPQSLPNRPACAVA